MKLAIKENTKFEMFDGYSQDIKRNMETFLENNVGATIINSEIKQNGSYFYYFIYYTV